jgi:hypothetical protein
MNRPIAYTVTCTLIGLLSIATMAQNPAPKPAQAVLASRHDIGGKRVAMAEDFPDDQYAFKPLPAQRSFGDQLLHVAGSNGSIHPAIGSGADINPDPEQWIGTWATSPQPFLPGSVQSFRNQTLRLIVHISAGGTKVRIRISNTFGDQPLLIGGAHIARRASAADIDPISDRALMFHRHSSTKVPARSMVVSDPVDLDVPALSVLALQTSYVSPDTGNSTAEVKFPVAKTIHSWPFLTG